MMHDTHSDVSNIMPGRAVHHSVGSISVLVFSYLGASPTLVIPALLVNFGIFVINDVIDSLTHVRHLLHTNG